MTSTHADTYATALQPKAAWQFFQGTLQAAPPSTRRAYSQTLASMARYLQAHHLSLNDIAADPNHLTHWAIAMLLHGATPNTTLYYLSTYTTLHNKATRQGLLPPLPAPTALKQHIRSLTPGGNPAAQLAQAFNLPDPTPPAPEATDSDTPRWFAMRLRPHKTLRIVTDRVAATADGAALLGTIYYPHEEIARRIGRKIMHASRPVLPDILFFRTRPTAVTPLFRNIGDLAWCYRTAPSPTAPYATIPDADMRRFQHTIGLFTPDLRPVADPDAPAILPGQRMLITSGPLAGLTGTVARIRPTQIAPTGLPTTDYTPAHDECTPIDCACTPIDSECTITLTVAGFNFGTFTTRLSPHSLTPLP